MREDLLFLFKKLKFLKKKKHYKKGESLSVILFKEVEKNDVERRVVVSLCAIFFLKNKRYLRARECFIEIDDKNGQNLCEKRIKKSKSVAIPLVFNDTTVNNVFLFCKEKYEKHSLIFDIEMNNLNLDMLDLKEIHDMCDLLKHLNVEKKYYNHLLEI